LEPGGLNVERVRVLLRGDSCLHECGHVKRICYSDLRSR